MARTGVACTENDRGYAQLETKILWSVVAEWLGRRTLNQRVVGSNPGEGTACIFEQDTLKSTARCSHNKQTCLRHP
jgi:hypothetical protein